MIIITIAAAVHIVVNNKAARECVCVRYRVGDRHRVYNSAVAGKSPPIAL